MNPYQPIQARIENIIEEAPGIKSFEIKPGMQFEAGQFIQLTIPGIGEAPFTPSSSPSITHSLEITVKKVGTITSFLHSMKVGDEIGIRGPYGIGYPIEPLKNRNILIVAGGVGLAPIRSLIFALFEKKIKNVTLLYGAVSPEHLLYKKLLKKWVENKDIEVILTVDVGDEKWKGEVGIVPLILEKIKIDKKEIAVVCGPPIMMKFTIKKLLELGYIPQNIFLSMERNMSCGLGKCGHCALGKYYVCKDGPVFTYDKIMNIENVF